MKNEKNCIGIWLDHRLAYIVILLNSTEKFLKVASDVQGRVKAFSKTDYGAKEIINERKCIEKRKHQIKKYFENIIKHIKNADSVFIFGPGETKLEFKKELEHNKL